MKDALALKVDESAIRRAAGLGQHFFTRFPVRSSLIALFSMFASLSESIGVVALLPLLAVATQGTQGGLPGLSGEQSEGLSQKILGALDWLGLPPEVGILVTVVVAAIVVKSLFNMAIMSYVGTSVARMSMLMRVELLKAVANARWSHFLSHPIGRFVNSVNTETDRAASAYKAICQLVSLLIQIPVFLITAVLVDAQLAIGAALVGLLVVLVFFQFVAVSRRAGDSITRSLNTLAAYMTDSLQGLKPIKAMDRAGPMEERLEVETERLRSAAVRLITVGAILKYSPEALVAVILGIGVYFAMTSLGTDIGTLGVMALLFMRTVTRFGQVQKTLNSIATLDSAFWSVRRLIDEAKSANEIRHGGKPATLDQGIVMEELGFAYGEEPVLSGLDADVPAGSFVCIVGPSGAGKSTLVDLLMGLMEPGEGRLLIDGVDMAEIDLRSWRRNIGYVPQELFLFHDSIRANVTLHEEDLTDQAVETALREAGAWDFVSRLPEGVETMIGERGLRLSGGQRQRIAAARALVRRPKLLILDEPTTALDPRTEAEICRTLRGLTADGLTIVAISHQKAVMEVADAAYELSDGKLVQVETVSPKLAAGS